MKPLVKVLDAIDEFLRMDELQLIANKRQFNFRYLREAREILAAELSGPTPDQADMATESAQSAGVAQIAMPLI